MLQELRQKPKPIREKYAFWGALGVTAVIALVWGLSLSLQLNPSQEATLAEEKTSESETSGAFSRSFSDIKNNMAGAWSAFTETPKEPDEEINKSETDKASSTENSTTTMTATSSVVAPNSANVRRPVLISTSSVDAESRQ